jgi:hypothetical protein
VASIRSFQALSKRLQKNYPEEIAAAGVGFLFIQAIRESSLTNPLSKKSYLRRLFYLNFFAIK